MAATAVRLTIQTNRSEPCIRLISEAKDNEQAPVQRFFETSVAQDPLKGIEDVRRLEMLANNGNEHVYKKGDPDLNTPDVY